MKAGMAVCLFGEVKVCLGTGRPTGQSAASAGVDSRPMTSLLLFAPLRLSNLMPLAPAGPFIGYGQDSLGVDFCSIK